MKRAPKTTVAFTLTELLVVIAVVTIAFVLVNRYSLHHRCVAPGAACQANLKQIGLGLDVWLGDFDDKLPWQVSVTNGGTMEFASSGVVYRHFLPISNQLNTPKILCCPAEGWRKRTTNFATLGDENVSYFISLEPALTNTDLIRAGDRNLEVSKRPVPPGLFTLTTNVSVGWTKDLHSRATGNRCGNLLFQDRHTQRIEGRIDAVVQCQNLETNRLVIP